MKNKLILVILSMCLGIHSYAHDMDKIIEKGLQRARSQSFLLAKTLQDRPNVVPKNFTGGRLHVSSYKAWTCGFFPGVLWYLYENDKQEGLDTAAGLEYFARMYTARIDSAKYMKNTHDLGFMLYCSFGNGYRLTHDANYLSVLKEGTTSLSTRFHSVPGLIRSWDNKKWQYPVIIDNMLNLEMLCEVSKLTGNYMFADMAISHADKTLKNHFRKDNSCYHVVSYDTITGNPIVKQTHQGYADESAWARGQAWALYGYTMMYRETRQKRYLEQAIKVATFIRSHPRLPMDKIPYWDFDVPEISTADSVKVPRDASAAACMASALIELSQFDANNNRSKEWLTLAEQMICSLTSDAYLAKGGEIGGFIIKHSVGNMKKNSEVNSPLTYADYYYVEALLRLKKLRQGIADRTFWVASLDRIARPVIDNLAKETLKKNMPYECIGSDNRKQVGYLEAFGRTLAGIAPWIENTEPTNPYEDSLKTVYRKKVLQALSNAVDPKSPDFLDYTKNNSRQPLVDAAYLAEGLLHAPKQLIAKLDKKTRKNLINALKTTRQIGQGSNNWQLFACEVEALLVELGEKPDTSRLWQGVNNFLTAGYYKGDGMYGDGAEVHLDYYNSLVISPMLNDVLLVIQKHKDEVGLGKLGKDFDKYVTQAQLREQRLVQVLERLVAPDGSYPAVGRSITYRFGHFHAIGHAAIHGWLPPKVKAGQFRSALTAVLRRQINMPNTFDENGWLTIGFAGHQPQMSEKYISTGSEYICSLLFQALGLPPTDAFWSDSYMPWTNLKAWQGIDIGTDHALRDSNFPINKK